ncbi:MAG: ABC transporter ATP-binding protein [Chloroflexi bacterium OHK40]
MVLDAVSKSYQPGTRAVDEVSLELARGQVLALLGPSGCGKTTTLRLIAGLERPDSGTIAIAGRQVAGPGRQVPPEERGVGLVFQDGALFPHLTIGGNIGFALNRQKQAARRARVAALLDLVGMAGLEERYPHQLSGGQQQRVALARALAPEPAVVLLDEPFANLDATLRLQLREEVIDILRRTGTTTLLVTHDQEEALSLADTVAVMFAGRIRQVAAPAQLYARPADPQVATFVGQANLLPGMACGDCAECRLGRVRLTAPMHGPVQLLIRPEALALRPDETAPWRVTSRRFLGHDQIVRLALADGTTIVARCRPGTPIEPGAYVQPTLCEPLVAYPEEES